MLRNVKIRKTKIWELEELKMFKYSQLKMLFRIVEERILSIKRENIKLNKNIIYYFYLTQQYSCYN